MSWDSVYHTAVAATAVAIHSLQQSKFRDVKKDTFYGPLINNNSEVPLEPSEITHMLSSETSFKNCGDRLPTSSMGENKPEKAPSVGRKISCVDTNERTGDKPENPEVEKVSRHALSLKRPPVDKQLNSVDSREPGNPLAVPDRLLTGWGLTTQPVVTNIVQSTAKPRPADAKAEAWEKEEIAKIRDRYEKTRVTIESWETKKKNKAKHKLARIEAALDKQKAKAVKSYCSTIAQIEEVAGGARVQAEENRRHDEFKVIEKASKIRLTGKVPARSLCF